MQREIELGRERYGSQDNDQVPGGTGNTEGVLFCCLLDTELNFLWATPYFISSMGYTEEEFRGLYQSLQQLCGKYPGDFSAVNAALSQARKDGAADIELDIRLPMRTGGFTWFRLRGTIGESPAAGGPVLKASLTDISAQLKKKSRPACTGRLCGIFA